MGTPWNANFVPPQPGPKENHVTRGLTKNSITILPEEPHTSSWILFDRKKICQKLMLLIFSISYEKYRRGVTKVYVKISEKKSFFFIFEIQKKYLSRGPRKKLKKLLGSLDLPLVES